VKDKGDVAEILGGASFVYVKNGLNKEIDLPNIMVVNELKGKVVNSAAEAAHDVVVTAAGRIATKIGTAVSGPEGYYEMLVPKSVASNIGSFAQLTYTVWNNSDSFDSFFGTMLDLTLPIQTIPTLQPPKKNNGNDDSGPCRGNDPRPC
jgi:hypothetical protein